MDDQHCPYCPKCGWFEPPHSEHNRGETWRCFRSGGSGKCQQVFEYGKSIGHAKSTDEPKEETQTHE